MSRELDTRISDDYVRFTLHADDLPLGADKTGTLTERALALAQATTRVAGAAAKQPIEFHPVSRTQTESSGASSVYLVQHHVGIGVFGAEQVVGFSPQGQIDRTQARLVAFEQLPDFTLSITSDRAVLIGARFAAPGDEPGTVRDAFGQLTTRKGPDLSTFEPAVVSVFAHLPDLPTVFEPGPFGEPIRANLVWFPARKELRLAWEIALTMPGGAGADQVVVAADDGTVLFCTELVAYAGARGNVFAIDPSLRREMIEFPRQWSSYDLEVPPRLRPVPGPWVTVDATDGNTTLSCLDETSQPVHGVLLDGMITFDPADAVGGDQRILNAFYGACSMHDLMYLLGFREADGSYQQDGTFAGLPAERLKVLVSPGPVLNLAYFFQGRIHVGVGKVDGRHTALDMTVVFHEYTHAVSSRLVGAGRVANPLTDPQSRGMAEGWGDFIACMATGRTVFGGWAAGDPQKGLRRFAYDEHFPVDQASFGIIASLQTYEIGELWCAFLMEMSRKIGRRLALQLVIDGMRGLQTNPSLLDGRDQILLALDHLKDAGRLTPAEHDAAKTGIWASAARFGMGVGAVSVDASLTGVTADTAVP